MSKKQVCLYQLDFMINCTKNQNGNGKIHHINKTYIDVDTNIENIACLDKLMCLCNK